MKINEFTKEEIKFIDVENDAGLKVVFANLGASIFRVELNGTILTRNVKNVSDFKKTNQYYGKTIGRVSNRMKGNVIKIDGKSYEIEPNESPNVLHGGRHPLSDAYFDAKTAQEGDKTVVTYKTTQKEETDGYPGDLVVEVKYIIYNNKNEIDVFYKAVANKNTVVSLTNHTYWCLGGPDINNISLRIPSHKYLDVYEIDLLPKEVKNVNDTSNFTESKLLLTDIDKSELHIGRLNGYDHFFYFDKNKNTLRVSNKNFQIKFETNFEGVQIYTHGFESSVPLYPDCEKLFNSVAIEPSDSFLKLHALKKDEIYSRYIKIDFNFLK